MTENKSGARLVLSGNINKSDGVRVNFDTSGNPLRADGKRFTALELEDSEKAYIKSKDDLNKELDAITTRDLAILANKLGMLERFNEMINWDVDLLNDDDEIKEKIEKLSKGEKAEIQTLLEKIISALERQGRGSKKKIK
ncbi:MAG: hypothetical protein WA057_04205 [Candidatus Magasanikiibacteriota bacterium]